MRTRFATGGALLVTQSLLLPTAEAQAADSGYSLITTGTCATTADCAAITTEADCRALHTLVDMEFGAGSGHFTVGSSQRSNVPAGCLFFSSASRHKFNDNMASTATCSATHRECSQRRLVDVGFHHIAMTRRCAAQNASAPDRARQCRHTRRRRASPTRPGRAARAAQAAPPLHARQQAAAGEEMGEEMEAAGRAAAAG